MYGAIILVFDILVLFLCCRRGARKVRVPLHSHLLEPHMCSLRMDLAAAQAARRKHCSAHIGHAS